MSDNPVFDSLYNNTLKFLSIRPRSENEILVYLRKKNASKKNTNEILVRLKEYNFVNDLEFTRWFIESRNKSIRIVRMELKQKGISQENIEEVLKDFDIDKKENNLIEKYVAKKWKTVSKAPKEKQYEKMIRFLLSKGFDYDESKAAVKKTIGSVDD